MEKLINKDGNWFVMNYIGEHKDILSRMKAREGDDSYEFIELHPDCIAANKDWLDTILGIDRTPLVNFQVVEYDGKKFAVLFIDEDDKFDFTDLNYQLGRYVGEFIVSTHLPTLSVDLLKSRNVIKVTPDEVKKYSQLNDEWLESYSTDNNNNDICPNWVAYRKYHHELARKYLKQTLKINVPKVYPKDIEMFREGLKNVIWDCDLSWYVVPENFFELGIFGSWCSTITLELEINDI